MNLWRVGRLCAVIGIVLITGSASADAQVFVYRVELKEQPGKQLNFDFYERGYFIAPAAESGTGTFIFTANDGDDLKYYTVAQDAARYFIVRKRSERRAVIFTSSENGSANSVYMAVGEAESTFNFGGEIGRVRYAEKMSGYVLAADDDSDPVYDDGSDETEGFAGMSTMTFTLDEARTGDASRRFKAAEEVIEDIVGYLEAHGYEIEGSSGELEDTLLLGSDDDGTPIFTAEPIEEGELTDGGDPGGGTGDTGSTSTGSTSTGSTGGTEGAGESGGLPETVPEQDVFVPGVGFGGASEISGF